LVTDYDSNRWWVPTSTDKCRRRQPGGERARGQTSKNESKLGRVSENVRRRGWARQERTLAGSGKNECIMMAGQIGGDMPVRTSAGVRARKNERGQG
jgi:hypothetical protein